MKELVIAVLPQTAEAGIGKGVLVEVEIESERFPKGGQFQNLHEAGHVIFGGQGWILESNQSHAAVGGMFPVNNGIANINGFICLGFICDVKNQIFEKCQTFMLEEKM